MSHDTPKEQLSRGGGQRPGFKWVHIASQDALVKFYREAVENIRPDARYCGYAIGVHGSMTRDLDLIAVPWTDDHSDKDDLARAIQEAACGLWQAEYRWERKPCGRFATSIPVCWLDYEDDRPSAGHIDLSVMAPLTRSETAPRVFPVIYWQSKNAKPGPMTIPWEVAEYAYSVYSSRYGRSQSLERLGERGGFHASELDDFVPDWRERASRITQLERELAQAQSDLVEVDAANVRLARDLQSARSATVDMVKVKLLVTKAMEELWPSDPKTMLQQALALWNGEKLPTGSLTPASGSGLQFPPRTK